MIISLPKKNMRYKNLIFSSLIMIFSSLGILQAQQTILPTGGDSKTESGSVSYSVGQIVYTSQTNENGQIIQGVQQAFEITVLSQNEINPFIDLNCSTYPNPTTDLLFLDIENSVNKNLFYSLVDLNGKLIKKSKIISNRTIIKMNDLPHASYILTVTDNKNLLKSFKIIKL